MKQPTPIEQDLTVDEHDEDTETTIGVPKVTDLASPDLNTLREIIFGPAIGEYNKRFRAIDRELESLRRTFEEKYKDLETKLNQKFESLNSEIKKSIREIDKQVNERIDQVSNKGEIDLRKLSTLLDSLAQELHEKVDTVSNAQTSQIDGLRDQMRRNYDTLRNELVTETDDLDERKLNCATIADSLIELGMKLKGENILDEINTQLADRT